MINEYIKFSTDKLPGQFFDTLQEAQAAEDREDMRLAIYKVLMDETNHDNHECDHIATVIVENFTVTKGVRP